MSRLLLAACLLSLPLGAPACGGVDRRASAPAVATAPTAATAATEPTARINRFDAGAAWKLIKAQVAVGQRPAGSAQLRALAVRLRRRLPHGRFERIPGEPRLRNVVSIVKGRKPALLIGAHYDTLVEPKGFVGANNGAAGTAIVVQLAREAARRPRPARAPELRFVLFDGEEPAEGLPEESADFYRAGLRGSRAYSAAHARQVGAMVLLDYVAGRGQRLPREASSTPGLWDEVRAAARRAGVVKMFPAETGTAITDDHTPFLRAGLPAVDLIDWTYPGHSLKDGLDQLSVRSVDAVGETIGGLIARWRP